MAHHWKNTLILVGWLLVVMPGPAAAQLVPLSDGQLADVAARSGVSILTDTLDLSMKTDLLAYHDDDGVASGDAGAWLSFCGIDLKGAVTVGSPLSVDMGAFVSLLGGRPVSGVNMVIDDVTVRIDHLHIDAIRAGNGPGQGLSYGGLAIKGMVARISGRIQIYSH